MDVLLPSPSTLSLGEQSAREVYNQLTSVIVGQPGAQSVYHFYEVLEDWLGPWGMHGYPLGYGKHYSMAFFNNASLMSNPAGKEWVCRTAVLLQEALRDYIVFRVRNGTIATLSEQQLRKAAFDSHPRAYVNGGLANVALKALWLIWIILTIPAREFLPASPNFPATYKQLIYTLGLVMPRLLRVIS